MEETIRSVPMIVGVCKPMLQADSRAYSCGLICEKNVILVWWVRKMERGLPDGS